MTRLLLGKVVALQRRDWVDLLAAQTALLRAQLLVWTRRCGALVTPLHVADHTKTADAPAAVRRLALAVSRAATYGLFRPTCLVRAVALHHLLAARGFPDASLRVGVLRQEGKLLAHAWVEYRGVVLTDEESQVKRYAELARMGMSAT